MHSLVRNVMNQSQVSNGTTIITSELGLFDGEENKYMEEETIITLEAFIAVFAFANNALVLIALWRFRSLRTPTNRFVASLALADIAVAVFAIPSSIILRLGLSISHVGCEVTSGATVGEGTCMIIVTSVLFLTQVSIYNLLLIAVDRFIAIHYPYRYARLMTVGKTKAAIIGSWLLAGLIVVPPELVWSRWTSNTPPCEKTECKFQAIVSLEYMVYFNFFGCILLPLIAMGVLYYFIFKSAKEQLVKIYSDVSKKKRKLRQKSTGPRQHQDDTISHYSGVAIKIEEPSETGCESGKSLSNTNNSGLSTTILSFEDENILTDSENDTEIAVQIGAKLNTGYGTCKSQHTSKTSVKYTLDLPNTDTDDDSPVRQPSKLLEPINHGHLLSKIFSTRTRSEGNVWPVSRHLRRSGADAKTQTGSNKASSVKEYSHRTHKSMQRFNAAIGHSPRLFRTIARATGRCTSDDNEDRHRKMKRKRDLLRREFHAAQSLATVVGIFALCWLPLHILHTVSLFTTNFKEPYYLTDLAILLSHANSLINPIIYALRLRDFRNAFRKIFSPVVTKLSNMLCPGDRAVSCWCVVTSSRTATPDSSHDELGVTEADVTDQSNWSNICCGTDLSKHTGNEDILREERT